MLSYFSITINLYFRLHSIVWVPATELFYMLFAIQNGWAHSSWVGYPACWPHIMTWHKLFFVSDQFLSVHLPIRMYIPSLAVVGGTKWHLLCRHPLQTAFYFLLPLGSCPFCAVRQPYCSSCCVPFANIIRVVLTFFWFYCACPCSAITQTSWF